jgi:hypothetical protein
MTQCRSAWRPSCCTLAAFFFSSYTQLLLLERVAALLPVVVPVVAPVVAPVVVPVVVGAGLAEVHAELPSVDGLLLQDFSSLGRAGDVDEVGVSESSRLASPPVNGNADVHDVANVTEEVVEVLVRHLEGHVSDEESLRRSVVLEAAGSTASFGVILGCVELDDKVAAFKHLHVEVVDGGLRVGNILELDVSETVKAISLCVHLIDSTKRDLPSAHTPVVVDDLDALNLTEAREHTLQLVRGNLVVEVTNV